MELLSSRPRAKRGLLLALGALSLASIVGCALLARFERAEPVLVFSHRQHVVVEGLDCLNCHEGAVSAPMAGMPSLDMCLICHDMLDEEKAPERRIETLFDAQGRFRALHLAALEDEVIFSHPLHARGIDCAACHGDVEQSVRPEPAVRVVMDDCIACHARQEVATECATCHRYIDQDWAPENHDHHWQRLHGRMARARSQDPAESCFLCHTETSCADCHLHEPPLDHTSHFRLRGHGVMARLDRDRCAACHRPDSCESCHADTRPRSHTGLWGGKRSTHCLSCHFPLAAEGCATCHPSAPSHLLATPLPPDHNAAMNCRQCHGVTVPLLHVDKGDNCVMCHH